MCSGIHTASYPVGTWCYFPVVKRQGLKLAACLQLVSSLRIHGSVHPLPLPLYGVVLN
jgi:hypothetical protein